MKGKESLEFREAVNGIKAEMQRFTELTDDEMEQAFFDIGAILKLQTEIALPKSEKRYETRKGRRREHKHLKDDVKYWVGRAKKTNQQYVSVFGGKDTGYKWGWVNDGHMNARDGSFVPGIHFLEKALKRSEGMIDTTIDEHLSEAVK